MHERRRGGPNPALLLLIPAVVILAKGASRRRTMWRACADGDAADVRVPPRIERILEAWHERAHEHDATQASATA